MGFADPCPEVDRHRESALPQARKIDSNALRLHVNRVQPLPGIPLNNGLYEYKMHRVRDVEFLTPRLVHAAVPLLTCLVSAFFLLFFTAHTCYILSFHS